MCAAVNGVVAAAATTTAAATAAGDQANGIERLRELEAMFLGGPVNAIDSKFNEVRIQHLNTCALYICIDLTASINQQMSLYAR